MNDTTETEQLKANILKYAHTAANLAKLLSLVAKQCRSCRACGVTIYMVEHANGKIAPYTVDGVNHFANCPNAEQFRKERA